MAFIIVKISLKFQRNFQRILWFLSNDEKETSMITHNSNDVTSKIIMLIMHIISIVFNNYCFINIITALLILRVLMTSLVKEVKLI